MPDLPDDLEHDHISNYELADDDPRALAMAKRHRSHLVTLTVWHPVGPVRADGVVMTDQGPGEDPAGGLWYYAGTSDVMDPQPTMQCDLPPPSGDDALTLDDLRRVMEMVEWALCEEEPDPEQVAAAARLRRALEQIGTP